MKHIFLFISFLFYTGSLYAQNKAVLIDNCGSEDYVLLGYKWNKTTLNYYIQNTTSDITYQDCLNAIETSFAAWSNISEFTFIEVNSISNADITIKWDNNFDNNSKLAETGSSAYNGFYSKSTIRFNDNITWAVNGSYCDVIHVAMHEIGHVLGIDESEYNSAMMYPFYHSSRILTADDICALWSIYGCPFPITGPSTVGSSAVYYIDKVPVDSRVSVVWSLLDTYYNDNCLDQDTPLTNQCTIRGSSVQGMSNGLLTADLYYNNNLLQTFTKSGINAPVIIFPGTYYNGQTNKPILLPTPLYVLPGTSVVITSSKLSGATVSQSGGNATPTSWTFDQTYNILVVGMPSTLNSVVVVHVACADGTSYNLPIVTVNSVNLMSVSLIGVILEVEITPNCDLSKIDGYIFEALPEVTNWRLEILNALTGAKVLVQQVDGSSFAMDTSLLKSGVYVIRATVGDEIYSEKVYIR